MAWDDANAAIMIQKIIRGKIARREVAQRRLHAAAGDMLLTLLESTRLDTESKVAAARITRDLERLPELVPRMGSKSSFDERSQATKEVAWVLCEVRGEEMEKRAFEVVQESGVAEYIVPLARECLEPPNTAVLYPLFAIMSNLPTLGHKAGEQLLKDSGCFALLIDCLYSADMGVQYYAAAGVSNMSHDVEAVTMVKNKKATAQLEKLLDSNNRHIINFALKALENVNEVQSVFDFLFGLKKQEIADRKARMEAARERYQQMSDADARKSFAAKQIQRWIRGRNVRKGMARTLDDRAEIARAAVRIQAAARGRMARKVSAGVRARLRALRMQAGVSKVSVAQARLKKRTKTNRKKVMQAAGQRRIERLAALAARLSKHDGVVAHTAMLLDATERELETLEAHADGPLTDECHRILKDLLARYELACAGGGPSGKSRLEHVQPLVAKFAGVFPDVDVHAAMLLFGTKTELLFLEEVREPSDPEAKAVLVTLSLRHEVSQAPASGASATFLESLYALVERHEESARTPVHLAMPLFGTMAEVEALEGMEPGGMDAEVALSDLHLRVELAITALQMQRYGRVRDFMATAARGALHAGMLFAATSGEVRRLEGAWDAHGGRFADSAHPLLVELRLRYDMLAATSEGETRHFDSTAAAAEPGAPAPPPRPRARAQRAQQLFHKYEDVQGVSVHPGMLLFSTQAEMERLEHSKELSSRETLMILTDTRVRHELAAATIEGNTKRLAKAHWLMLKFEDVPYVHSAMLLAGTKPEVKRLETLEPGSEEAHEVLEALRMRFERQAAQLLQMKRERAEQAATNMAGGARTLAAVSAVRPTVQAKVERSTAVATHAQAAHRRNKAQQEAQQKRERQAALNKAQRVFPVYQHARESMAERHVAKKDAATTMQAHYRGQQARGLAEKKEARQSALHRAGVAGPATNEAARKLKHSTEVRVDAAITLQRYWRGYAARKLFAQRLVSNQQIRGVMSLGPAVYRVPPVFDKALAKRQRAAILIQRHARGRLARLYAVHKREVLDEMGDLASLYPVLHEARGALKWLSKQKHFAAIEIQRHWRGYSARKRVRKLLARMAREYRRRQQREYVLQMDAHMYRQYQTRKTRHPMHGLPPVDSGSIFYSPPPKTSAGVRSRSPQSTLGGASEPSRPGRAGPRPISAYMPPQQSSVMERRPDKELDNFRHLPQTLRSNISYYPGRAYLQAMHALPAQPLRKYVNTQRGQSLLQPLPRLPNGLDTQLAETLHVPSFQQPPPKEPDDFAELAYGRHSNSPPRSPKTTKGSRVSHSPAQRSSAGKQKRLAATTSF